MSKAKSPPHLRVIDGSSFFLSAPTFVFTVPRGQSGATNDGASHGPKQWQRPASMDTRGVSEEEAYQMLRSQAMLKREQIETVASEIVKARETLCF